MTKESGVAAELCERLDMPLCLTLIELALEWDQAVWNALSSCLPDMLVQARLLADIIENLNGSEVATGEIYSAAATGDGWHFALAFERLFLTWEEAVTEFDSEDAMPDNTA